MARIPTYTPQVEATGQIGGRGATANDFGSSAAGYLGAGMIDAGDTLYKVAEQNEVATATTQLAKFRSEQTVALKQKMATSPAGDPSFASSFTEQMQDQLTKIGGNFSTRGGQMAFQRMAGETSASLSEAAGSYQVLSAGFKAKQDYLGALDANRNTLLADPTQFDSVLRSTTAALADPAGPYANMPADQREHLARQTRSELALSAAQGVIRISPDLAVKQLATGRWDQYLDADKKFTLERQADQAVNAKLIQQERNERLAEKALKKSYDAIGDTFLKALNSDDPAKALSTQDVLNSNLPVTGENSKEHWLNMIGRTNKPDPIGQVSAATTTQLFANMKLPDGAPDRITNIRQIDDAFINNQLTRADHDWLVTKFKDDQTDDGQRLGKTQADFLNATKPLIDHSNPILGNTNDPSGPSQFYLFNRYVDSKVQEYRQGGKNPYDLFDPRKPDYIGSPETVSMFQKSMQDSMNYITKAFTSGNPAGAYGSAAEVAAAHKTGKLSRDDAAKILRDKGWVTK
jgi:hypothetical protein